LGAEASVNTPDVALMANFPESVPPVIEKVTASLFASVAVTVVTAVVFSAMLIAAVAPLPLLVMS
jgi:hypothetical protein